MKSNVQIASALVKANEYFDKDIMWDVVHTCPEVLADSNLVMHMLANQFYPTEILHRLIVENSVIDIQNDIKCSCFTPSSTSHIFGSTVPTSFGVIGTF